MTTSLCTLAFHSLNDQSSGISFSAQWFRRGITIGRSYNKIVDLGTREILPNPKTSIDHLGVNYNPSLDLKSIGPISLLKQGRF